jgi:hypothetical protein
MPNPAIFDSMVAAMAGAEARIDLNKKRPVICGKETQSGGKDGGGSPGAGQRRKTREATAMVASKAEGVVKGSSNTPTAP